MRLKTRLLSFGVMAAVATAVLPGAAMAADAQVGTETLVHLDIPGGPAAAGLNALATQAGLQLFYPFEAVRGRSISSVKGDFTRDQAIQQMASAAGLRVDRIDGQTVTLAPQSGSAAGDGADGTVQALVVTAQKREENIQDVPIAMSAFTQEDLTRSQVAGGPDLMTQVPNMTFTKTNFTGYSIQIRGIGTQAISATTDPAVAVAFNNTPFIRNRFFEQEFYDLQRVEVLRGPQGTLYGRNATAGVVNLISAKPKFSYEAKLSADVANYGSTRLEGMVNIPLVDDIVALRLAGAWTKRDGFVTNEITGNPIDGRDLWSTRMSLRIAPTDRLDVNLIWEHFNEDDDRLRSGKQLCKKDNVTEVGGHPVGYFQDLPDNGQTGGIASIVQSVFSQGCLPNSLYDKDSFQTPNGFSIPYYYQTGAIGLPIQGSNLGGEKFDPYLSRTQSRDLRTIESTVDPSYRAKSDVFELQIAYDLTDNLSLTSETAWSSDFIFATQDFNRFNTAPQAFSTIKNNGEPQPAVTYGVLDENGFFCDPQIGCADRLVAVDLSTADSQQFSQELRLASNFDGPFNFSLGTNFLRYDTEDKYYVFINSLSMVAYINGMSSLASQPGYSLDDVQYQPNVSDNYDCLREGYRPPNLNKVYGLNCIYADPNPIGSLNDQGHNYFLSRNPYKLISYAVFGEAYYNIAENLKVTAGLRWTVDKKEAPRIPSWILAGGTVGYPVQDVTEQEWREPTGRLTIDWKPDLPFTDETLLYASYAHGYKAGGANPPPYGTVMYCVSCYSDSLAASYLARTATAPRTFDPEFVDAYELGAKNTLFDGRLTLNTAAFYYDYKGYQISQIIDRSAFNQNFDATVWGLEVEADWRPLENLRFGLKLGYENTRVADGERAIDIIDRTNGQDGWVVVRPFPTFPSNCVLPAWLYYPTNRNGNIFGLGSPNGGGPAGCEWSYVMGNDPVTYLPYEDHPTISAGQDLNTWDNYPGYNPILGGTADDNVGGAHNFGQGFYKDLSGNELPNAPHYTATLTTDYTIPLSGDWLVNLHADLYYQSEAWTRIFNMEGYDKLKAYTNLNLAAIFTNEEAGWTVMAYVKNVMDRDSITGAFLNSDDTGLTTNVFLTEPRLYGLRVTKAFDGGPWWTGASPDHTGPYPFTVEVGGQVQRHKAPYETLRAGFEDLFPDELNIFAGAQNRDFDWGDGRSLKLTFRPDAGPWMVSADLRYGRTNTDTARPRVEIGTESQCMVTSDYLLIFGDDFCTNPDNFYRQLIGDYDAMRSTTNWADASARSQEKHELADLTVSRDFGTGMHSRSTVGVGLRHAAFDSETMTTMAGAYDRFVRDGWYLPGPGTMPFHERDGWVRATREFKGMGPMLSWEAAVPLIGGDDTGRVALDWSVGGGLLFGQQETEVSGQSRLRDSELVVGGRESGDFIRIQAVTDLPPISFSRSDNVTVPVGAVSLGLSYEIQRIKLSTGYRWERYFDVLDVGFDAEKKADRTIDGPYFKIAVGFGG